MVRAGPQSPTTTCTGRATSRRADCLSRVYADPCGVSAGPSRPTCGAGAGVQGAAPSCCLRFPTWVRVAKRRSACEANLPVTEEVTRDEDEARRHLPTADAGNGGNGLMARSTRCEAPVGRSSESRAANVSPNSVYVNYMRGVLPLTNTSPRVHVNRKSVHVLR